MTLHLLEFNKPQRLLGALAENLGAPKLFETRYVIVPGRHWFSQVKDAVVRCHKAFFQVEIQTFDSFAGQAFQAHADGRVPAVPDTLAAAIFLELTHTNILQETVFSLLRAYLLQGGQEIRRDVAWQVSRHLGELFTQYHAHRPELAEAWRTGRQFTETAIEAWQKELFLRMTAAPGDPDDSRRLPFPDEWVRANLQPRDAASCLHVVASADHTPAESLFIQWMAREIDVFCYISSPSREFFEQARRGNFVQENRENHPLLDAWGALSARTVKRIHEISGYNFQDFYENPTENGTLALVQAAILNNTPESSGVLDDSLRIWRFLSRKMECAAVREDIERRLQKDPNLSLADFAVVVPPADGNAPGVEEELAHVFSQEPVLPIQPVHRRMDSENRMLQAVQALMRLPLLDAPASAVAEIVLHPLVGAWTPEEGQWVRRWVSESGAVRHWSFAEAAAAAPGDGKHSWEAALTRLALGAAAAPGSLTVLPASSAQPGDFGVLALDFSPGQWPSLARFMTLVHGLRAFCGACREARPMAQWAVFLEEQLRMFLQPITRKDEKVLDRVLEILHRQGELAVWGRFGACLSFPDAHAVLAPFLQRLQVAHSPADGRGVFVGPLQDAAGLPFSHVYLVGLEDGVIARDREPASLDVGALEGIPGHQPGARGQDLACCLSLLYGTAGSVTFSWCARDPVTGDAVAPNVVIRDLLSALQISPESLSDPPAPRLREMIEREYASRIAMSGAAPPRTREELEKWPAAARAFWKTPEEILPSPPSRWERPISWKKLAGFWNFPLQAAAANWFAPDVPDFDELQEWEPENLDFWQTRQWILETWVESRVQEEVQPEDLLQRRFDESVLCGRAPAGVFGETSRNFLLREAKDLFNRIQNFGEGTWEMPAIGMDPFRYPGTLPALRLENAARRLTGVLPPISFDKGVLLMVFWSSQPEVRHVLEACVAALAACALRDMSNLDRVFVQAVFARKKGIDFRWEFPALEPRQACSLLARLADAGQKPAMLVPVTAEMAMDFLREQDGETSFDAWYKNEISSLLVDETNQKPKLARDPLRDLETLADAHAAFRAAGELYLNPEMPLAKHFMEYVRPRAEILLERRKKTGENTHV